MIGIMFSFILNISSLSLDLSLGTGGQSTFPRDHHGRPAGTGPSDDPNDQAQLQIIY